MRVRHHHAKKGPTVEIIDIHPAEVPFLINNLYNVHNKPDICDVCGKQSEFIRIEMLSPTRIRIYKICRKCLFKKK